MDPQAGYYNPSHSPTGGWGSRRVRSDREQYADFNFRVPQARAFHPKVVREAQLAAASPDRWTEPLQVGAT